MTESPMDDLLDGFLMAEDAIIVPPDAYPEPDSAEDEQRFQRHLVLAALRQALQERQLDLPLGPSIDPEDPSRLLSLNQIAVQLVVTGISSDAANFAAQPWRRSETAPQLLVAAGVDDDLRVVQIAGVLTGEEVAAALGSCEPEAEMLQLPIEAFKGGIERLFTLAWLVQPSALPRRSLFPASLMPRTERLLDWCRGQLSEAFQSLGATLLPVGASAFRQGSSEDLPLSSLALVTIPLGIDPSGQICAGDEALRCVERFRLLLIPSGGIKDTGEPSPEQLTVRLQADLVGDLLPYGLELIVAQGGSSQRLLTADGTASELQLPLADTPIRISITAASGLPLELPDILVAFTR